MRSIALLLVTLVTACSTKKHDTEYYTSTVTRYVDAAYSRSLSVMLQRIEEDDRQAWTEFVEWGQDADGEHSQTYSVACAELLRRAPTFFLRKYLNGDADAIELGRVAYGWAGNEGRSITDKIYARRLYIATDGTERERIMYFIDWTTSKE